MRLRMIATARSRPSDVDLLALRRHRLQDDLEAALEVEAERRLLVDRRARDREQGNADERREDEAHQDEMRAPLGARCSALG